jgi:peptidyl-prolyl cis-trans isomerase C
MTHHPSTPRRLLLGVALLALLGACSKPPSSPAQGKKGVVATVNGHAIRRDEFDLFLKLSGTPVTVAAPTLQRIVLNRLIDIDLLAHQAHKAHLEHERTLRMELKLQKRVLLANAFVRHYVKLHPISPKVVADHYRKIMARVGHNLYEVRTIRVAKHGLALTLAHDLAHGESFALLARHYSQAPSAKHGGFIGWIGLSQLPPPVAAALRPLKPGAFTPTPIKTASGWHLYLVEARHPIPHPSLKDMAPRILAGLREQMVEGLINRLRAKAKVSITKGVFRVVTPPAKGAPAAKPTPAVAGTSRPQGSKK